LSLLLVDNQNGIVYLPLEIICEMKNLNFKPKAQAILTFRKWGRKSYSSFLTVNKAVVISVLSVVYLLSAPVITLATEQDTTDVKMQYDLDQIEVSAQRSPVVYSQVARIISVIERKEIEAAPAQSVQDLLEYIAGVDVRQRGAEGVQADVSVRGGTFDQTLILLNGINITDPQTGHHNFNLPVSLAQIERIEILEGPAARVYGPNAFSGAINVVSKQNPGKSMQVAAAGGSFGYFNGSLSGSFQTGKMNHLLAFNGKRSDGYIDNTDFKDLNGFYSNQLDSEKGTLKFQLGLSEKGFGANSFYTPKYPNQYEETKTLFTSLKWEGKDKLHLSPLVYYRRNQDRFELFRDNPASWYTSHNYHLTNVYGTNLNSWFNWAWGKSAFGVEYRSENILSNVLGEDLDEPIDVPGEDAQFTKSDSRNTVSVFIEHAAYLDNWTFTAGLMSNYISGSDLGINVFPGIDVSYNLSEAVKLYTSYNTSLRMPTFTDLYYDGPTNIGNPDLLPEKSATLEGGLKWSQSLLKGHAVVFYRQGKDIIDWVKLDDDAVWQPQNLTEINNLGTEVQLHVLFRNEYGSKYPNVQFNYLYNSLDKKDADFVSNYVLDNLKHKLVGSLNQQIIKNLSFDLKFVFQDREGTYTKYEDLVSVGEVDYEPFWLFDGKLSYSTRGFVAFASVNNIFDTKYNDIGNVIQSGRWLKAGISYKIDFN
jgi:iron complex outermembrane receptor protein